MPGSVVLIDLPLSSIPSSTLNQEPPNCWVRSENPTEDTEKHLLWFLALGRLQTSGGERYSYMETTENITQAKDSARQ